MSAPRALVEAPPQERVTVPLLDLVARGAVDEDYARAARRRVAAGTPAAGHGRHTLAAAGIAVFGLLLAIAAVQTSRNADVDSASRSALIDRINTRRSAVRDQQAQIRSLRGDISDLQGARRRLDSTASDAQARLQALQVGTGFVAVTGPGVRIRVDDAPSGDPDGRVRASDLRLLVDALWQSGADAVAINGRRLTTLSSIVNANIAIQVNRGPISPPYDVEAIGDPRTLASVLTDGTTGLAFASLADDFGFAVSAQSSTDLQLPAAPPSQLPLRFARPAAQGPGNQDGTQGKDQ